MANAAPRVQTNDATGAASAAKVDMKLEIVVIPVADVDRAKAFYGKLGWRVDADFDNGKDFRVVQLTPPGSGCSVIFGKNVTAAAPGSAQGLYLIVPDIKAARDNLLRRGVEVSEVFHGGGDVFAGRDELRIGERSGERLSTCGGRPRRAREAPQTARRELAGVVCRLHGGGAVWERVAAIDRSEHGATLKPATFDCPAFRHWRNLATAARPPAI